MTNSKLFREILKNKQTTITALAEKLGLSRYGLSLKIDNVNEFKSGEIVSICEILGLSLEEKEALFFVDCVDNQSTERRDQIE